MIIKTLNFSTTPIYLAVCPLVINQVAKVQHWSNFTVDFEVKLVFQIVLGFCHKFR
jgi:hypothetical protein